MDNRLERSDGIHTEWRDGLSKFLSFRTFGCLLVQFSLKGSSAFLNYWDGVLLDGVLLSWKTEERRETAQEEEAWNRSGMNPKQREHAGKDYRRLLHNPSANTKCVKMLRMYLKRSNNSLRAVRLAFDEIILLEKVIIRLWGKLADHLEFAWLKCQNYYHFMEEFHIFLFKLHTEGTYRPRDIFGDLYALTTFPVHVLKSKSIPKNYKNKISAYHGFRGTKTEQHTILVPAREEQNGRQWQGVSKPVEVFHVLLGNICLVLIVHCLVWLLQYEQLHNWV